jgi:hypothetical protein
VDPKERRAVILGGSVAGVGAVGCVVVTAFWNAPKGLLESDPFMGSLAVVVLGLALIVAAGARDALLTDPDTRRLPLQQFGEVSFESDTRRADAEVTIRPVFRNLSYGDVYRTRYELALQRKGTIEALLMQASARSVLQVRCDDVSISLQEMGNGVGHAWASVPDPPSLFRLDVITSEPEDQIKVAGFVR